MLKEKKYIVLVIQEDDEVYGNDSRTYKKEVWYFPRIEAKTKDIIKFSIKDINNLKEVKNNIYKYYADKYISNNNISKPIKNRDTNMYIEIWKSGINETFGNINYYKNLSLKEKQIKLITMDSLAKMIKYGKIRSPKACNYHNENSVAEYYYLKHPIIIDDIEYIVNMDIRKVPNSMGRFYIHSIQTKKVEIPGN